MSKRGYSVTEVAEMFGVSRATIHNWLEAGEFPNSWQVGDGRTSATVIPPGDIQKKRDKEIASLGQDIEKLRSINLQ